MLERHRDPILKDDGEIRHGMMPFDEIREQCGVSRRLTVASNGRGSPVLTAVVYVQVYSDGRGKLDAGDGRRRSQSLSVRLPRPLPFTAPQTD